MDLVWVRPIPPRGWRQPVHRLGILRRLDSWDNAPAPAQFGKRVFKALFLRDLPAQTAGLVNNLTHWATGVGWGAAVGLLSGSARTRRARHGLVFGAGVWVQSYAVLVPAKLYRPPWDYDAVTLWKDLSAHLVYGLGTATSFPVLARRSVRAARVGRR